jgi:hypothetical protein
LLTLTSVIAQRNPYCAQPFAIGEAAARTGNEHRGAPDKVRAIEGASQSFVQSHRFSAHSHRSEAAGCSRR